LILKPVALGEVVLLCLLLNSGKYNNNKSVSKHYFFLTAVGPIVPDLLMLCTSEGSIVRARDFFIS
jgi:hypothetical protein